MSETVVAATATGRVRGERREHSLAFRGIPYAAAPVGELRFAAPAPHPGWDGVRDALVNGPTPSLGPTTDTYSIPEPVVPGDDLLNLNVFTPTLEAGARLPVYVWIHGGGFVGGSPGGAWFDGDAFARRGVVTVVITYRLGFEGYGDIPGVPGNRALRDAIAALEWVAQNIAHFGGDPDQVTVGGQSAGGSAVLALLVSPAARGLFRGAVCHSGPLPDIPLARAERVGLEMARGAGLAEHNLDSWRQVPREQVVATERARAGADLLSAVRDLHQVLNGRDPITDFGPVIDGDILPVDPVTAIGSGDTGQVPLLLGVTSHEFNPITAVVERFLASGVSAAVLMGLGVPPVLARAYPRAYPDFSPAELLGQAVSDRVFRIPAVRVGLARAQVQVPTWMWDFRWRSPVTERAVHCVDLPFAWHRLGVDRVARIAGEHPPVELAEEFHGAVVQFVTAGRVDWPMVTVQEPAAKVWDAPSWVGRDPFRFERIALEQLELSRTAAT